MFLSIKYKNLKTTRNNKLSRILSLSVDVFQFSSVAFWDLFSLERKLLSLFKMKLFTVCLAICCCINLVFCGKNWHCELFKDKFKAFLIANILQDIKDNIIDHDDIELEEFYSYEPKLELLPQSSTEKSKLEVVPAMTDDDPRYDYQIPENEEGGIKRFCAHKIKRIFVLCWLLQL